MTTEIMNIRMLLNNIYKICYMIENEVSEVRYRTGVRGNLKRILKTYLL